LLLAVVLVLQDNEVTNKRLMKIFKDKTREFRETVNQLFGWRVDYTEERSVKRYRLKSMYAEKDADELVFQKTSKSDLELMATDFSWYTKTPVVCRVVGHVRVACCVVCRDAHRVGGCDARAVRWTWRCRRSSVDATRSRPSWPT
jgi:hypothetical protein